MVLNAMWLLKRFPSNYHTIEFRPNLNQPVQYYINYIPGGGGYLLSIMAYMERPRPKGYLF